MDTKEFFELLQRHDWYYEYSDDHRVWKSGRAALSNIKSLASAHPTFNKMYSDYSKHMFSGDPWGTEKTPKPKLEDYL